MAITPIPDPAYELPPPEECEELEAFIVLEALQELRARFVLWDDRYMVEFAVMQITRSQGQWRQVARIDTKHGHVHRHQLRGSSPDDTVGTVQSLEVIPVDRGWEVVDRWYEEALKVMQNEWRDNLRRWKGDRT